ncbi:ABC transporter permease [Hyphomicrobium nitrativorans NL23]|uniref:ABC transporter permease n=1 Tax=Hyphomicrobium nitrativorans NL23 TaxID=1029756 RepID=V5SEF3_9HYPH|nr:high-affinity branched-chain amino acid ABC transporter permease LivM [Hyphomicrobium nitrativorans]AHB48903.1 ABC transporter permease [Hyphomicrobium nitrativorans NL23]
MGPLGDAIKKALLAALVTFGLSFPIVIFLTRVNLSNQLVLEQRWWLAALFAGAAFIITFAIAILRPAGAERAPLTTVMSTAPPHPIIRELPRVGLVFLIAYPFLVLVATGNAGAVKWIDNFGIQILIYILLAWGLNVIVGFAGLLDLGFVAFYAVGAYSTGLLAKTFGLSFWILLPLAGILAAFWALIVGLPVLRLRGDYIAIVTLAFAEIVRLVLVNWVPVTGGYAGVSGIPAPSIAGYTFTMGPNNIATALGLPPSPLYRLFFLFYLILALVVLCYWVTTRLRTLPVGRAWEAMREDEIACRSLGISIAKTKLSAMAAGAFFGGLGGAFFASRQGFISPESFVFMESAVLVAIVVLGGLGNMMGVAIAAVVMIGGTELLRELTVLKRIFGQDFDPTQYRMLLFGLAMVMIMVWRPKGLIASREPSVRLGTEPPPRTGPVTVPAE